MSEFRVTEGARKLRAWLRENEVSVPDFCDQHGLDRIQVQRVLNGERWRRITVDFACAIEVATRGRVSWRAWLSKTAREPKRAAAA